MCPIRQEGVRGQAERCILIREQLREKLRLLGSPGQWEHLTNQTGLYCCTGLSGECRLMPFFVYLNAVHGIIEI